MGTVSIDVIKLRTSQNKDGDTLTVRLSPLDETSRDAILLARPGSQFKMTLTDLDQDGNANSAEGNKPPAADREVPASPAAGTSRLTRQAGIACNDPMFRRFLDEYGMYGNVIGTHKPAEAAATAVRLICHVKSRREFIPGTPAGDRWQDLYSKFVQWRDLPDAA